MMKKITLIGLCITLLGCEEKTSHTALESHANLEVERHMAQLDKQYKMERLEINLDTIGKIELLMRDNERASNEVKGAEKALMSLQKKVIARDGLQDKLIDEQVIFYKGKFEALGKSRETQQEALDKLLAITEKLQQSIQN